MLLQFSSLLIVLVLFIVFFISSISASPRIFLISPTTSHFDPISRTLDRTWPENVDFTKDVGGGIVIFDGALPPNTKMEIRGIKAKRIEFNATLSPGCTLLIENCELVTTNADAAATDTTGGLVIASTIFTSSDGMYGCAKINSTVWTQYYSSSPFSSSIAASNVQIIIRNNTISNFGASVQYDSFSSLKFDRKLRAAINIYNPIICKNNADDNNQISTSTSTTPTMVPSISGFDIKIISNKINITSSSGSSTSQPGNEYGALGIFIFGLPANNGDALRDFFTPSLLLSNLGFFYEPNVPLASLNVSDNSVEISGVAFASAIFVGYWEGYSSWNDYLFERYQLLGAESNLVLFEIARNSFVVTSTGFVGSSIFSLGSFGLDANQSGSTSIPFTINFHNQKKIILSSASYQAVLYLENLANISSRFKSTVNYFDNNNNDIASSSFFVFNRSVDGGPNEGFSLIFIISNRNDTSLFVSNSDFTFLLRKGGQHSIAAISGLGMGNVTIQHTNLFLKYQIPSFDPPTTRTANPTFEAFCAWLTFYEWTFVTSVNVIGNTYTDKTNSSNAFYGVEFHRVVAKSSITSKEMAVNEIEGAWGMGVGSLVVRNCVVDITSLMGLHLVSIAAFVPRMGTISVENNTILVVTSYASLIRLYTGNYDIMCYFERLVCRGNYMKVRHTSAIFAQRSTANFSNFADLVSISRFKITKKPSTQTPSSSLNFLIENNTFDSFGFQISRFILGGSFAEQNDKNNNNQQMLIIRNNIVIVDAWERSNFLVAAGNPELSMNVFLLDSNVITISAAMSSTLIYLFNGTGTMDKAIPINFFILNNFINVSTALTGGIVTIESCRIDSIYFNNNVMFSSVDRTREPIAPQQLSKYVAVSTLRILSQFRLTTLTGSTIEKIYTTTTATTSSNNNNNIQQVIASTSSTSIIPKCSYFNNVVLSDRLISKFLDFSIPLLMLSFSGSGIPKNEVSIINNHLLCVFTTTRTTEQTQTDDLHHSHNPNNTNNNRSSQSRSMSFPSPTKNITTKNDDGSKHNKHPQFADSTKNAFAATSTFILSALAAGPSLAAISIRTQSVLSGVNQIVAQDCESTFSVDFLETAPPVGSSPMQLYFSEGSSNQVGSNGGYATGTIVGDAVMILILVSVWVAGFYGFDLYFSRKQERKSRNNKPSIASLIKFLAKSKVMIPLYNFSLMFLDPMLNSAVAILAIREVSGGWKFLGVLISIVALTIFFFFYVIIYKLSIQRNKIEHFHKFRPYELKRSENLFFKICYFLMEPEGEWWCPREGKKITKTTSTPNDNNNRKNNSKNDKTRIVKASNRVKPHKVTRDDIILYDFAEPIFDGFTSRFPLFTIVDLLTVLGMTLALLIGDATANCTILGVLLLIPLVCHFAIVVFYRPDQELLLRFGIPFCDLLQIILVICALAGLSNSAGGKKVLDGIAFLLMSVQMLLTILWVVSIALTAHEMILRKWRRRNTNGVTNKKVFNQLKSRNDNHARTSYSSQKNNLRHVERNTEERRQPQSRNMNNDKNRQRIENYENRNTKNQKNNDARSSRQMSSRSRSESNGAASRPTSLSSKNNKVKK